MLYTLVFTNLIVTMYICNNKLVNSLGRYAMHYTLVFTSWFVTIYIYKFDCNHVNFKTNELTARPMCNALCTCIYKFVL